MSSSGERLAVVRVQAIRRFGIARVPVQRAAAALPRGNRDLEAVAREHLDGGGVHRPEQLRHHAAREERDAAAARAVRRDQRGRAMRVGNSGSMRSMRARGGASASSRVAWSARCSPLRWYTRSAPVNACSDALRRDHPAQRACARRSGAGARARRARRSRRACPRPGARSARPPGRPTRRRGRPGRSSSRRRPARRAECAAPRRRASGRCGRAASSTRARSPGRSGSAAGTGRSAHSRVSPCSRAARASATTQILPTKRPGASTRCGSKRALIARISASASGRRAEHVARRGPRAGRALGEEQRVRALRRRAQAAAACIGDLDHDRAGERMDARSASAPATSAAMRHSAATSLAGPRVARARARLRAASRAQCAHAPSISSGAVSPGSCAAVRSTALSSPTQHGRSAPLRRRVREASAAPAGSTRARGRCERARTGLERREARDDDPLALRHRAQPEGRARDHAERAERAAVQPHQVEAGHVLHHAAARRGELAVRERDLDAEHFVRAAAGRASSRVRTDRPRARRRRCRRAPGP